MSLTLSWKEMLLGTARGLAMLGSIDTEDIRSAWVKRGLGNVLQLHGVEGAINNAFHRGSTVIHWDEIRRPLPAELVELAEALIDAHAIGTRQKESIVVRTLHTEYTTLREVAQTHEERDINEFMRRLVVGLTDPVFCYATGYAMQE